MKIKKFRILGVLKISIRIVVDCSKNLMEGAFFPGEIVRGEFIFNFDEGVKARSIIANYVGIENSYVRRTEGSGNNSRTVTYHDYYYYFHIEDRLMEPEAGEEYLFLYGEYNFNFEFKIPEDVPGTFCIDDSSIKYLIDVKVDIPRHSDIHKMAEIIILPNTVIKAANSEPNAFLKSDGTFPQCELSCFSQIFHEQENIQIDLKIHKEREHKFRKMMLSLESVSTKTARGYTDNFPGIIKRWKIEKKEVYNGDSSFVFDYEIPYGAPFSIYGTFMKRELFIHLKIDRSFKSDRHLWLPIYILPAS